MDVWIDGSTTDICVVIEGLEPIVRPATDRTVTSNEGEYHALLHALRELISMGMTRDIHVMSDSELMVRQLSGVYETKNVRLLALRRDVQRLMTFFKSLSLTHVSREENVAGIILERRQHNAKT